MNHLTGRVLYLLLAMLSITQSTAQEVGIDQRSAWIQETSYISEVSIDENEGYRYLLIENQENLIEEEVFRHHAVKVFNAEGIQSLSDISIEFDPTFQKLTFHRVDLIRDGERINKLSLSEIKTYQRETSLERSLYDGALSAVINLSDVREGDIIEYAYTVKGFNPINNGEYANTYYQQFSVPINKILNRVIASKSNPIQYKLFDGAPEPRVKVQGNSVDHIWEITETEGLLYDNNVPAWVNRQQRVMVTTYEDWKQVVDWGVPLYNQDDLEPQKIKQEIADLDEFVGDERLIRIIQFVQDEVRYLGFESGIGAYKPNSPQKVISQRYGDCKDKSLLLISLLKSEGIAAYPLLVNSYAGNDLGDWLPSNGAFNHCVVGLERKGEHLFVDPTISSQGGDLNNLYFPDYKVGLAIRPGVTNIMELPDVRPGELHIDERYSLDEIGGSATVNIRSSYKGFKADNIRTDFNSSTIKSIQKQYLNFYSGMFPGIEQRHDMDMYDHSRFDENEVILEEFYNIPTFWKDHEGGYLYVEVYSIVLESLINYTESADRTMPYYLSTPHRFTQKSTLDMPEDWTVSPEVIKIEGPGFEYEREISGAGTEVTVEYRYEVTKDYIEAEDYEEFMAKHQEIRNDFTLQLTYSTNTANANVDWIPIVVIALSIGAGLFFSIKINRDFDPEPWEFAEDKPIGSWLILPAIGVVFAPLALLVQVIDLDFIETFRIYWNYESAKKAQILLFIMAELSYNLLLIIFGILVMFLFFSRRTSVPKLMSIYYLAGILGPIMDEIIAYQLIPELLTEEQTDYSGMIRSVLTAAIWIPYFNVSERAKSTFCKRRIEG